MDDSDILGSFLLNFGALNALYEYAENAKLSLFPYYVIRKSSDKVQPKLKIIVYKTTSRFCHFKGTVSRDFLLLVFKFATGVNDAGGNGNNIRQKAP
jgi:hypothetical protein